MYIHLVSIDSQLNVYFHVTFSNFSRRPGLAIEETRIVGNYKNMNHWYHPTKFKNTKMTSTVSDGILGPVLGWILANTCAPLYLNNQSPSTLHPSCTL